MDPVLLILDGSGQWNEIAFRLKEAALDRRKGQQKDAANKPCPAARSDRKDEPDWAEGLRQLYNSVVEEPLPDSFDALLKKLGKDGRE